MGTKKTNFKLFIDILKEDGKYSQGRVYLLWSILAYYITLGILTVAGITKSDIEVESFEIIIKALEYAMTLFAGYVFGGKAIKVVKSFKNKLNEPEQPPSDSDNV